MTNLRKSAGKPGEHALWQDAAPGQDPWAAADLAQLQAVWLQFLAASGRRASSTVRCYQSDLRQFHGFLQARGHSMRVGDVTPAHVARFRDSNTSWKPATVQR